MISGSLKKNVYLFLLVTIFINEKGQGVLIFTLELKKKKNRNDQRWFICVLIFEEISDVFNGIDIIYITLKINIKILKKKIIVTR